VTHRSAFLRIGDVMLEAAPNLFHHQKIITSDREFRNLDLTFPNTESAFCAVHIAKNLEFKVLKDHKDITSQEAKRMAGDVVHFMCYKSLQNYQDAVRETFTNTDAEVTVNEDENEQNLEDEQ
jgi:hypothetical protein